MQMTRFPIAMFLLGLMTLVGSPSTLDLTPSGLTVDGRYLRAFQTALSDLSAIPDLTERQKRIDGYLVTFNEDDSHIYVLFIPKRTEAEKRTFGGRLLN